MILIVSLRSVHAIARRRPTGDMPKATKRSSSNEWSGSGPIADSGSSRAVAASSKEIRCFARFSRALTGSHAMRTRQRGAGPEPSQCPLFHTVRSGGVNDNLEFLRCLDALQDLIDMSEHCVFDQILRAVSALEDREPLEDDDARLPDLERQISLHRRHLCSADPAS